MGFTMENGVLKSYTDEPGVFSAAVPEGVKELTSWIYTQDSTLKTLHIPAGVTRISPLAIYFFRALEEIVVDENNPFYASEDGLLYDRGDDTLLYCPFRRTRVTLRRELHDMRSDAFPMSGMYLLEIRIKDSRTEKPMLLRTEKLFETAWLMAVLRGSYEDIKDTELKLQAAAFDLAHGLNEEAGKVVRKNFIRTATWLIDHDEAEMLEAVLRLCPPNARQLNRLLDDTIGKQLPEMQLLLMAHKNRNGGYGKERFRL